MKSVKSDGYQSVNLGMLIKPLCTGYRYQAANYSQTTPMVRFIP